MPEKPSKPTPEELNAERVLEGIAGRLVSNETFQASERATKILIETMQEELDAQRVLTKYNRRTWFQVMGYLTFGIAGLTSVGREYDAVWFALVFPLVSHEGGPENLEAALRAIGALWQVGLMYYLWKASQVPDYLLSRVTSGAMTEAEFLAKWPHNDRRQNDLPHKGPERRR